MHILFVTGEYPPMKGGVGAYTQELGLALVEQGVQVSVLTNVSATSVHERRSGRKGSVRPIVFQEGVTSTFSSEKFSDPFLEDSYSPIANTAKAPFVYPIIKRWDWRIWQMIAKWAAEQQVDWIHVQYQTAAFGMNPAINFAPQCWKRLAPHQRIAWTYHDLLVPYLFPKAGAKLRRWVTERPALTTDLAIVTNEGDRLQLTSKVQSLAKIPIGSNIEGQKFSEIERTVRRTERGYGENDLVLAYFGFLNRSKGGTTLIRTVQQLVQQGVNAHLLMIGERVGASDPTNFAYLQEVEALITEFGLQHRVQWTGHQPDAEVSADLNACDLLLMPYEDGASLRRGTLMAGLAHGCAIITTRPQSPLPELVDGQDVLFVMPRDIEATSQAALTLIKHPELVERLRENAKQKSQLFRWSEIGKQHIEQYLTCA